MRVGIRLLVPALLAVTAVPALGEKPVLNGAAALCMQARADVELGPVAIGLALARAGLGGDGSVATRDAIEPVMVAILEQCIQAHGLPDGNPRTIGGYLIARATRIEAGRRLAMQGISADWLDGALAGKQGETGAEFRQVAKKILARMKQDRPAGLGIDATGPDTRSRTTAELVYAYAAGALSAERIGAQLRP
ncbi:MAG: hypothetical protein NBV68_04865 [Erythrobacter sp.]|uniref:hypothetical protein n=1 Tax=Erythrobacter sp. TaxID=1042 RepID=UPI0025F7A205|nr:hypothetical protein [Erythrobacter sp.]MCL9998688.1 hypothetical protein [Erythrobacter sp.]